MNSHDPSSISRRDFLRLAGVAAVGTLAAGCQPTEKAPETIPVKKDANTTKPVVAIAQADSYDPQLLDRKVSELIDQLGGLGDVVKAGDTVAIKVNLTAERNRASFRAFRRSRVLLPILCWRRH